LGYENISVTHDAVPGLLVILLRHKEWGGDDEKWGKIRKIEVTENSLFCCGRVTWCSTREEENLRGGADKSLARPISQCRRTESIVSLERRVNSCVILQLYSCCKGWKEACEATRVISIISRHDLSSSFFFSARQGYEGISRHSEKNIRGTCTIVCHCQNWVA